MCQHTPTTQNTQAWQSWGSEADICWTWAQAGAGCVTCPFLEVWLQAPLSLEEGGADDFPSCPDCQSEGTRLGLASCSNKQLPGPLQAGFYLGPHTPPRKVVSAAGSGTRDDGAAADRSSWQREEHSVKLLLALVSAPT